MRLACSCHVSCQDGYNPADLGDRAGLEEEKAADELLVVSQQGGIGSGRSPLQQSSFLDPRPQAIDTICVLNSVLPYWQNLKLGAASS